MLIEKKPVRSGKMFGFPAYYAGKKLSICLYEDGVAVKIPEEMAKKLFETDQNAKPFHPMGRLKMKEWVQIDLGESEKYLEYEKFFYESIHYVLTLQKGKQVKNL